MRHAGCQGHHGTGVRSEYTFPAAGLYNRPELMDGSAPPHTEMKVFTLIALIATIASPPALAEVIRVPVGPQAAEKQTLRTPPRGLTKTQVRARFGDPRQEFPAVGDPPISSWDYENYRVYFEGDLVLHAVLKGSAQPVPIQP